MIHVWITEKHEDVSLFGIEKNRCPPCNSSIQNAKDVNLILETLNSSCPRSGTNNIAVNYMDIIDVDPNKNDTRNH